MSKLVSNTKKNSKNKAALIHILYEFKEGPWGGGNQFLKALRQALRSKNLYAENKEDASAILFNSHHFGQNHEALYALETLKQQNPSCVFLHRIDGPVEAVRGHGRLVDKVIFEANSYFADGSIFQTQWSYQESLRRKLIKEKAQQLITCIGNAPDSAYFYPNIGLDIEDENEGKDKGKDKNKEKSNPHKKFKIIATSWAANKRKGFDIYEYLDNHLDFSKYSMQFVGNSPIDFKNISYTPALNSKELGATLRKHDIYITGSINDPCSNALYEGLHCGLPALVRNSGGHPEILKKGGLSFDGTQDVIEKLEQLTKNYKKYKDNIDVPSIEDIADQYYAFAQKCLEMKASQDHFVTQKKSIELIRKKLEFMHWYENMKGAVLRRVG